MTANKFKLGKIFENKETSDRWRVEKFSDGEKYFVLMNMGDVSSVLDEELFKEIN